MPKLSDIFDNRIQNKIIIIIEFFLFLLLWAGNHVQGQNTTLTDINGNRYQLNPAWVGDQQNQWNIYNTVNNLNTGFGANLQTFSLAAEYQVAGNTNKLAAGFSYFQRSMFTGPFSEKSFYGLMAYHFQYKSFEYHAGIQPGLVANVLMYDQLLFPDQYDRTTGGYNGSLPTSDILANNKVYKLNLNAGIAFTNLRNNMKIGFAVYNLLRPNLSFTEWNIKLPIRYAVSYTFPISINPDSKIQPSTNLIFDNEHIDWIGGGTYHINSKSVFNLFSAGVYYRYRNAGQPSDLICHIGFQFYRVDLNLGYSKPLSNHNNIPRQWQSFEISMIVHGYKAHINNPKIPCNFF